MYTKQILNVSRTSVYIYMVKNLNQINSFDDMKPCKLLMDDKYFDKSLLCNQILNRRLWL